MDRMGNIRRFRRPAGSLAILLSTLLLALPGTAQATAGWQTYTHPQLGFSLSYPDEWVATNGPSGVVFMVLGPLAAGAANFPVNGYCTPRGTPPRINLAGAQCHDEAGAGLLLSRRAPAPEDRGIL